MSRNTLSDTRAMARNLARRLHTGARARIYTSGMSPALNYIPKRTQTCPRRFPLWIINHFFQFEDFATRRVCSDRFEKGRRRGTTTKIIVKEKARFEGEFPSRDRECDCFSRHVNGISKFGTEAFNNELKFSSRRDQRHYYFQVLRVSTRVARVIVYREIPFIYGYNYRETFNRIELTLSNFQIGRSVI